MKYIKKTEKINGRCRICKQPGTSYYNRVILCKDCYKYRKYHFKQINNKKIQGGNDM